MSTSVNGWTVLDGRTSGPYPRLRKFIIPGTGRHFVLRDGSAGFLLAVVALWWHERLAPINVGIWDEWGWAVRPVRGQTSGYSNHASGTATDTNATRHPIGVPVLRTFQAWQTAKLRVYLAAFRGVLTWGGVWGRPDGMHVEITSGRSLADVERVARVVTKWPRGKRVLEANPGLRAVIFS